MPSLTCHGLRFTAFNLLRDLLLDGRLDLLALDVEAEAVVDAHVLVGDPDECEAPDEVAAPVLVEQPVARDEEEEDRHVVAEAVLAGKEVEEFSLVPAPALPTPAHTELPRLAEDLLVRHGPGDARDGDREHEEHGDL